MKRSPESLPQLAHTPQDWDDYLGNVDFQFSLIDRLTTENRAVIHEIGYDAVVVRRMLAAQRRATERQKSRCESGSEPPRSALP